MIRKVITFDYFITILSFINIYISSHEDSLSNDNYALKPENDSIYINIFTKNTKQYMLKIILH